MFDLQELLPTKEEGESRIATVGERAEKTLPQTAVAGQQQIRRELDSLRCDWDKYSNQLTNSKQGLSEALGVLEEFDSLFDNLSKWLRDVEGQMKDYELKSTLADKEAQVEKFKVGFYDLRFATFELLACCSGVCCSCGWN